jgi:hypothetical protein
LGPATKFEITKSSIEGEREERPEITPGMISGSDLEEVVRGPRRIARRLLERAIHALDARPHRDGDERDAEHRVGEQQGRERGHAHSRTS